MLFMATTASTAVALTLWPSSAADELRYHPFHMDMTHGALANAG